MYAKVFEEEGAFEKLEGFALLYRPAHYGLPPNEGIITLEKCAWIPPAEIKVAGEDERALVHHGGERLEWQVVG